MFYALDGNECLRRCKALRRRGNNPPCSADGSLLTKMFTLFCFTLFRLCTSHDGNKVLVFYIRQPPYFSKNILGQQCVPGFTQQHWSLVCAVKHPHIREKKLLRWTKVDPHADLITSFLVAVMHVCTPSLLVRWVREGLASATASEDMGLCMSSLSTKTRLSYISTFAQFLASITAVTYSLTGINIQRLQVNSTNGNDHSVHVLQISFLKVSLSCYCKLFTPFLTLDHWAMSCTHKTLDFRTQCSFDLSKTGVKCSWQALRHICFSQLRSSLRDLLDKSNISLPAEVIQN